MIDQAASLHQARRLQTLIGHHQARPQDEGVGAAIGLAEDRGANLVIQRSDLDDLAEFQAEAVEQFAIGNRAPMTIALGKGGTQRSVRRKPHLAEERVACVDCLQLDQLALGAARGLGHGAQRANGADPAGGGKTIRLCGGGGLIQQTQLHVPAQERASVAREPALHRAGQRADTGDERHTESQAEKKQAKAAQAAAQLAARQAPGERQSPSHCLA